MFLFSWIKFDDDDENGDRFARLNKQYENIRANLVKTLTESWLSRYFKFIVWFYNI